MRHLLFLLASLISVFAVHAAPARPPAGVTNNAVAFCNVDGVPTAFSFSGLKAGKTFRDVTADAFAVDLRSGARRALPPLPDNTGRLASVAATVADKVYVFGGYTVAADGTEVSTPDVFAFDPRSKAYRRMATMPAPVDDSVAFAYRDRFVYLVSGWHNDGNVAAVQVFDTQSNTWARATDYPGTPVFGHAGGLVDRTLVVVGGVAAEKQANGRNKYAASDEAWYGEIDEADHLTIRWQRVRAPPIKTRYRIAATGSARLSAIVFAGGTDNPYNYDGIGYDKRASAPSAEVFAFDVRRGNWIVAVPKPVATMDHRGLIEWDGRFYTLGGMDARQRVIGDLLGFGVEGVAR